MTAETILETVRQAGGVLWVEGETLRYRLPQDAAHLVSLLREQKPEVLAVVRARGGRVATFPHCPRCASYALYRENNRGLYECMTCGLAGIEECVARRVV